MHIVCLPQQICMYREAEVLYNLLCNIVYLLSDVSQLLFLYHRYSMYYNLFFYLSQFFVKHFGYTHFHECMQQSANILGPLHASLVASLKDKNRLLTLHQIDSKNLYSLQQ